MTENQSNSVASQQNEINLKDILFLYLSKWKWFVLSLAVCIFVAVMYLLCTEPVFTRSATLLIEDNDKGSSISNEMMNFSDMGLFQSNTNVNNEIIAISSPALMQEVVQRLQLTMNYRTKGTFHDVVMYGTTLPVSVKIDGLDDQPCKFTLKIAEDGSMTLTNFEYEVNEEKQKSKEKISATMSEPVQTPVGQVTITPTAFYQAGKEQEIFVSRSSLYSAVRAYSSKLNVSLMQKEATVVSLSIEDVSTQRANDVLNTLISVYNESWVEAKNQIAVSTSLFIDERLRVIEKELGVVDEDISAYKSENLIPDIQAVSDMYLDQSSKTEVQILELNNRMYMVKYIMDYMNRDANTYQLLPAGTGIESTGIEQQISEYNTILLERNNLVANSSVTNPLVVDRDQALQSMHAAILSSLRNYEVMLETQLETLRQQEADATGKISTAPDQAKYLLSVERQQKVKESLYLFLLQKREENELSQAFTAYNTRVITPPTGDINPTSPVKTMVLLVALVLGMAIPMGVFFIQETGNTKLRGKKDLEHMSVPYIGEIPLNETSRKKLTSLPKFAKRKLGSKRSGQSPIALVVREGERNVINEAFRVVRTNLEFMTGSSRGTNSYIVTSFNVGSGKSFLTANLAMSLAIKKKKVILVDGDIRKATISSIVGKPKKGLSDWLAGRVEDVNSLIVRTEQNENMFVLPCGTIPPNPAELLMDVRLKNLVDNLKKEYDYVFIDCPPINIVADTQIISRVADRTIFVVRSGLLERSVLPELENDFKENRYPNMCMLLNGTISKGGYGYRYGYRYGYNYGYGYGYGYHNNK